MSFQKLGEAEVVPEGAYEIGPYSPPQVDNVGEVWRGLWTRVRPLALLVKYDM